MSHPLKSLWLLAFLVSITAFGASTLNAPSAWAQSDTPIELPDGPPPPPPKKCSLKIKCPKDVTGCADTIAPGQATAEGACPPITVVGVRSDGKKLTDPYPPGVTSITWTATDSMGGTDQCTQKITAVALDKVQYKLKGAWTDVPAAGFDHICQNSTITFKAIPKPAGAWPANTPVWGGDASGTGEIKTVKFEMDGARTVTCKCDTQITIKVGVDKMKPSPDITWLAADITTDARRANCSCVEKAFVITYAACADIDNNKWRLRVDKIEGNCNIAIHTGGYRDPTTDPPTSEAQAAEAVKQMQEYYTMGKGSWHTEAASRAHELYHYQEWQCSSNHYWPDAQKDLEDMTVDYDKQANAAAAIAAMRGGASGADKRVDTFKAKAKVYWNSLSDTAPSRPYGAGQLQLNPQIMAIQTLAAMKGWTVPAGTTAVSARDQADPCYRPFGR